jgi:DnaJ-class molecular chaperone
MNHNKFREWLDQKAPSSFGSPIYETKNILVDMLKLIEQQKFLEDSFVSESESKEQIQTLKNENSNLKNKVQDKDRMIERIMRFGKVSACPQCDGQGGWQTGPDTGEECDRCGGAGLIRIEE